MIAKLFIIPCLFILQLIASPIDKLTFVTEEYPPYNYTENGTLIGKNTAIITQILKLSKSNQNSENILILPWAKGYEMALSTPNTALFSTLKTKQRESLFHWIGPLASHKTVLLARNTLTKEKRSDISNLRVVVIHKDAGAELLELLPNQPKQVITASSNIEAAQMLYYGRVDAWAYGESTGKWILQSMGLNPKEFLSILTLAKKDLYLALHPESDLDAINEIKKAFQKIQPNITKEN